MESKRLVADVPTSYQVINQKYYSACCCFASVWIVSIVSKQTQLTLLLNSNLFLGALVLGFSLNFLQHAQRKE